MYALNRGATQLRPLPAEVTVLQGDIRDANSMGVALSGREFDVVVTGWPSHLIMSKLILSRFRGRIGQYIFISSASAYQTPPSRVPITESTPLHNPYWQYSRNKIVCEDRLVRGYREEGFPRRSCGRRTPTIAPQCRAMPAGR